MPFWTHLKYNHPMQGHAQIFLQDFAIIMLVSGLTTVLFKLLKQPVVLGYIVAGIIIGPHTPPFSLITDETITKTLAEFGVIFLMFSLGLEFDLKKLVRVGKPATITAVFEIIFMGFLGYLVGLLLGWSSINAIFLGAILSISSTTIIIKALDELNLKKEKFADIVFGILIVEDIFAILILALLSALAVSGVLEVGVIFFTSLKLLIFLVVSLVVGILVVPRILAYVSKFRSNEMLLIVTLAICFGFCLLVLKLEYSVALGAFIIAAIIEESKLIRKIESLVHPLRDMFSAIFFVSVGLLFDPRVLVNHYLTVLIITIVVIFGKVLSCSAGVFLSGNSAKTSLRAGMSLAQIGEFSFIIAALGVALNVIEPFLFSLAVAVSIITTLTTPYLIMSSEILSRKLSRFFRRKMPG